MSVIEPPQQQTQIFRENSWWLKVCLLVMFLLATLVRLDEIKAPGHLLDREYTSAIFARAYYLSGQDDVESWRQEIAVTAKEQQPVLEPALLEYLVSVIYRLMGREELYFARYLTNAFWLIGGIFMYLIAKRLLSTDEAVIATAYYLFVPMGIIISRSFQPDSLMMMMFLISLYFMVLYFETSSTTHLLAAGFLTGITLLLRPLVIFAIFLAFPAFSLHRNRNWKKLIDLPLLIFSATSLLPSVLYYGYGILYAGFMRWKISTSFMPFLLTKKDFWLGWLDNVVNVAEITPLLLAILGFFLLRNRKTQYLVIALSAAFMIFSVAFTYHIHTHPYYHIQLFPIVGLCLAPVVVSLMKLIRQVIGNFWWIPIMGAVLLGFYVGVREVRGSLYQVRMEDPVTAWKIGEIVHHNPHTVYVAYYYGVPLAYYGELGGAPWPVAIEDEFYRRPDERSLSVQERIDSFSFTPEYYVITNFSLYNNKHQDLKEYLEQNCQPLEQNEEYLIYTSCGQKAGG
jgi:4-amino-4-deoxy-L-arabinose transferase-like glycosyltransferase